MVGRRRNLGWWRYLRWMIIDQFNALIHAGKINAGATVTRTHGRRSLANVHGTKGNSSIICVHFQQSSWFAWCQKSHFFQSSFDGHWLMWWWWATSNGQQERFLWFMWEDTSGYFATIEGDVNFLIGFQCVKSTSQSSESRTQHVLGHIFTRRTMMTWSGTRDAIGIELNRVQCLAGLGRTGSRSLFSIRRMNSLDDTRYVKAWFQWHRHSSANYRPLGYSFGSARHFSFNVQNTPIQVKNKIQFASCKILFPCPPKNTNRLLPR